MKHTGTIGGGETSTETETISLFYPIYQILIPLVQLMFLPIVQLCAQKIYMYIQYVRVRVRVCGVA